MDISIIIVSWNVKRYVEECLSSITTQTTCSYETIVIDNASKDGTAEQIRQKFPEVKLIENQGNFGFARANNQGIRISRGRYIVLLNPDTIVVGNAIDRIVELMDANPDVHLAGGKLLNPDGTLQPSLRNFPNPIMDFLFISGLTTLFRKLQKKFILTGYSGANNNELKVHKRYVNGAFLSIRSELFEEIGFFDECYSLYFEETDFCYRCLQHGYKIAYFPSAKVVHYGGKSSSQIGVSAFFSVYCTSLFRYYRKFKSLEWLMSAKFAVLIGSFVRFLLLFFCSIRSRKSIIEHCETCFKIAMLACSSNKGTSKSIHLGKKSNV